MSTNETAFQPESPTDTLRDAFSQSHNAVQWLARMVSSFRSLNAGSDIALRWNDERNAFVTDDFADGLQMEMRLPELTLQFLEHGQPAKHELQMEGRTSAQVEAWILVELLHRGIDRGRFSKDLPYVIPHPMAGDSVEYSPDFREGELKTILNWFSAAANLLKTIGQKPGKEHDCPSGLTLCTRDFSLEAEVPLIGQAATTQNNGIRIGFFPLRMGVVDPHYRVARSESSKGPDVFEIIKVSGTSPAEIAGPAMTKRISEAVAKLQKLTVQ
ncbi:hypothetical protein [Hyphomicrobium sp. ghe19]|uniref:hypothetical protein n=1 Tax=Hyphomicrobium sp. ghe19 TaxID=2682968 RepID=UPI0013674DED|nr:hypothetical protein HYPP_00127 [Hyphomicrobium sp. ghe19]